MNEEQRVKILHLLEINEFGVIATNSENNAPESAVVAISQTEDLDLIFGTFENSRKFKNIIKDNRVSIVIGWDNIHKITMQIEGLAMLVSKENREFVENIHCKKNPSSERFRNNIQQKYFTVKPYWVRYSDFSKQPQEIWELNLK